MLTGTWCWALVGWYRPLFSWTLSLSLPVPCNGWNNDPFVSVALSSFRFVCFFVVVVVAFCFVYLFVCYFCCCCCRLLFCLFVVSFVVVVVCLCVCLFVCCSCMDTVFVISCSFCNGWNSKLQSTEVRTTSISIVLVVVGHAFTGRETFGASISLLILYIDPHPKTSSPILNKS